MGSTEDSRARIARYKEERRRQLEAQYGPRGAAPASSSSEDAAPPRPPAPRRPRRAERDSAGLSSSPYSPSRAPAVRTTRASRLRAAATTTTTTTSEPAQPGAVQSARLSAAPAAPATPAASASPASTPASALGSPAGSPASWSRSPALLGSTNEHGSWSVSPLEKDKSRKRKSNLNRAYTEEAGDTGSGSRRRTRTAAAMAVDSLTPSPVPTAAAATPSPAARRLSAAATPPPNHGGEVPAGGPRVGVSSSSPYTPVIRRVSPIRVTPILPPTRMSPRNLHEDRPRNFHEDLHRNLQEKLPRNLHEDRPRNFHEDIPGNLQEDLHRNLQEDLTRNLHEDLQGATSRLVQMPAASRALGVEESVAEADVSQSVDRLTALAKETLARVDRITAESSASLRRLGSTPPANKSIVIVSKAEQDVCRSTSPHSQRTYGEAKPVSILKRKTSHDEGCVTPPVTFSPSVLDQPSRRHGILKKSGGSFDESRLRRSCSPETEVSGSILKNRKQRRSSLEDSTNRQSILKRKDSDGPEPHGILKKRSSIDNSSQESHISIAEHVILAANGDITIPHNDDVRPILKKRSSLEDQAAVDPASFEVAPKPILKKKSSTDTDDNDEWPKKTILKTSRRSSREEEVETSEAFRRRSVGSAPLLQPGSPRLSFCHDEEQVSDFEDALQRRIRASRSFISIKSTGPSGSHSDFSSGVWRRRSWDPNGSYTQKSERGERPLSVAERVSSMESALSSSGGLPTQPRVPSSLESSSVSSSSVSNRSSSCHGVRIVNRPSTLWSSSASPPRSPPPLPSSSPPSSPPSTPSCSAFLRCTSPQSVHSPIRPNSLQLSSPNANSSPGVSPTSEECSFAFKNHVPSPLALKDSWSDGGLGCASRSLSTDHLGDNWILKNKGSSPVQSSESWSTRDSVRQSLDNNQRTWDIAQQSGFGESRLFGQPALHKSNFESSFKGSLETLPFSFEESKSEVKANTYFPEDDKIQQDSRVSEPLVEGTVKGETNMEVEEEKRGLQRSASRVSEKAMMFAQMEEKMKQAAEEARARRLPKADENKGIARYRNRKADRSGEVGRFSTQPITVNELRGAKSGTSVTTSASATNINKQDDSEDENDPSKLSLAERVKLFNQAMTSDHSQGMGSPAQTQSNRRRLPSSRFKTQPVTIEEVSTAQNIIKQPPQEIIGVGSTQAAKEIFEIAARNLSKSVSCSRVSSSVDKDARNMSPKRGILKTIPPVNVKEKPTSEEHDTPTGVGSIGSGIGLEHIKKVLSDQKKLSQESHSAPANICRRASLGTASHSSSESESDSSSDSNDEGNRKSASDKVAPHLSLETKATTEKQEKQTASTAFNITKRPTRSDHNEKVRNSRNTCQEKENQGTQNILKHHNKAQTLTEEKKSSKVKSEEDKKMVKEKLEVRSEFNQTSAKRRVRSKEFPTRPCSSALTSDDGDTSSGGQEVRRIISNEAVARRHQANLARQQLSKEKDKQMKDKERPRPGRLDAGLTQRLGQQLQLRLPGQGPPLPLSKSRSQHCQPLQQEESDDEDMAVRAGGLRRCLTQPMPDAEEVSVAANASIADRLKLLQQNGQTGWRKRVATTAAPDVAKSISESQQVLKQLVSGSHNNSESADSPSELVSLQRSGSGDRSSILADRLGKLENASQDWRKRVGQKDAEQFSVKGKMKLSTSTSASDVPNALATPPLTPISPLATPDMSPGLERRKKVPKPVRFCSKTGLKAHAFKRSLSAPGAEEDGDISPAEQETPDVIEVIQIQAQTQVQGPRVEVPRIDDTFDSFFSNVEKINVSNHSVEITDVDLDVAVTRSSELLVQKRTVKVSGRRIASRNPVKALSARKDLCNEYFELRTGVAEREMKRLRAEKLAKNSSMAVEALAGLASKEDFSAVSLRKSASTSAMPNGTTLLPYKEIMLLQVKGRRHIQTRLIEPTAFSINSGDNFVLVTPSQVYNWVGRYSNVIERARGAEIALHVQQNKDLGFNGSSPVVTICEERGTCSSNQSAMFWRLLGSLEGPKAQEAGHPDEDEIYETAVLETNIVYELQGSELIPFEKYWGCIPRIEMLDPSKILIFDFGSELYVWNGKNAPLELRKVALQLAKELWEQGYDYSECDVCPLLGATHLGPQFGRKEVTGNKVAKKRPSWALIAKVTQHMETILFREKFLDWPDFTRVIQARDDSSKDKVVDASVDVRPCDAKEMFDSKLEDPDLLLEGSHLGRGSEYYDEETRRFYEIQTTGVKMWHIQEYEYSELPKSSFGQFNSADNFVVRWAYRVTVTTRALNGQPSKHAASQGRDRFCYFCWQGRNALLNDKGAAALLTVELDKERGPQVFITQGLEPPAFLGLFEGEMATHSGRREDRINSNGSCRMYAVRGEVEREANLVEVTPSMRHLRSRGSFLLINEQKKILHVWNGSRSLSHIRKVALSIAQKLQKKLPQEFCAVPNIELETQIEEEGSESQEFLRGVGGNNRHLYVSLTKNMKEGQNHHSPRLFHLTSLSGTFTATEVAAPCRNSELTLPYPFQQSHLYGASQPALFMLDNGNGLWLWQGWWPSERDESDSNTVAGGDGLGSGAVRWQAERRAAMKTASDYWSLQHSGQPPQAYLVWAGLEPLEFTNLFLEWTDRDDIAEINIQDGHKAGELLPVEAELARLTQSTYPAAQLLQRPLPDGVDPTRLELYLAPQHFQEILGMSKEEFLDLPQWKQTKIKKDAGLF